MGILKPPLHSMHLDLNPHCCIGPSLNSIISFRQHLSPSPASRMQASQPDGNMQGAVQLVLLGHCRINSRIRGSPSGPASESPAGSVSQSSGNHPLAGSQRSSRSNNYHTLSIRCPRPPASPSVPQWLLTVPRWGPSVPRRYRSTAKEHRLIDAISAFSLVS